MPKRPPIPAELERQVLLEAGHRCAIHACRQVPVEIAHIVPWSRCRAHEFQNLIGLCPTCHTRYDGGQIDRKSMMAYKRDAWLRSSRYSDLEKRLLLSLAMAKLSHVWVFTGLHPLISEAIKDGLLTDGGITRPETFPETFRERLYTLTAKGEAFAALLRDLDAVSA